jgi:hypothetical protein
MKNISIFATVIYLIIKDSFIALTARKAEKTIIVKFTKLIKL